MRLTLGLKNSADSSSGELSNGGLVGSTRRSTSAGMINFGGSSKSFMTSGRLLVLLSDTSLRADLTFRGGKGVNLSPESFLVPDWYGVPKDSFVCKICLTGVVTPGSFSA